jgi:hypothetical protein
MTQKMERAELESSRKIPTGAQRRIFSFILPWVQGLAPAQGSVKPTAGFTTIKFC